MRELITGFTGNVKFHSDRKRAPKGQGLCSGCHAIRDRGNQRYCKKCHAAYMRENRPKLSEMTPEQRQKAKARNYACIAQKRGQIERKPCENCGSPDSERHHEDYSKPLEITWLCRKCHLAHHKQESEMEVLG